MVVAEVLDRLSRDQEHVASLYKQLTFAGVKIVTLAEGEISALHVGLKGSMNALFLSDLRQKVRRGLEGRVRQGRSGGGLSYGYDVVREVDAGGEPVYGGRSLNEAEAAIVRRGTASGRRQGLSLLQRRPSPGRMQQPQGNSPRHPQGAHTRRP